MATPVQEDFALSKAHCIPAFKEGGPTLHLERSGKAERNNTWASFIFKYMLQ